jgi:ATP adenylyltransferase
MPEILWAPWRLVYVQGTGPADGSSGDIFLDLPAENDDRKNLILFRGSTCFVLMNAFPYTSGHLLIAPYRQVSDIVLMSDAELLEVNKLVASSLGWIRKVYRPDGFNIGVNLGHAAGAGIPSHLHWHVVPRWSGDTNFMSVLGDTRVIPQALPEAYDRLREALLE